MGIDPDNVTWRNGTWRDVRAMRRFKCTDAIDQVILHGPSPDMLEDSDRDYELRVQRLIQGYKPGKRSNMIERAGYIADTLAAVMLAEELVPGSQYNLCAGAVSLTWRRRGVSDLMMLDIYDQIKARAIDDEVEVFGEIDRDNDGSKKMAARHGMAYCRPSPKDPRLEQWRRVLDPRL